MVKQLSVSLSSPLAPFITCYISFLKPEFVHKGIIKCARNNHQVAEDLFMAEQKPFRYFIDFRSIAKLVNSISFTCTYVIPSLERIEKAETLI